MAGLSLVEQEARKLIGKKRSILSRRERILKLVCSFQAKEAGDGGKGIKNLPV